MSINKHKKGVAETFTLPNGFDFDLKESFKKISASQFGRSAQRGFCEIVQNAIDSYDENIPIHKRSIEITSTEDSITVKDFGEGMSRERLSLITTLGGTDKGGSKSKIGQFGIGFFAIFNPALTTRRVEIDTICEQNRVNLVFEIDSKDPTALPRIVTSVEPGKRKDCGSSVTISFSQYNMVPRCLGAAADFLRYLPCKVTINGNAFEQSIWHNAEHENGISFEDSDVRGIVYCSKAKGGERATVMSRYERVLQAPLVNVIGERSTPWNNIMDYHANGFPYIPYAQSIVNCNSLRVTLSRDSVRIERNFHRMIMVMRKAHRELLLRILDENDSAEIIMANQFTVTDLIRDYLESRKYKNSDTDALLAKKLATAKVYPISGEKDLWSLEDICRKCSSEKPVYFSPSGSYTNWLGGTFDHDFVVLPPVSRDTFMTDTFFDQLFSEIFSDVVNLDTVQSNQTLLESLVKRGLVDPDMLSPVCNHINHRDLKENESAFLDELNELMSKPIIHNAIDKSLCLDVDVIQANFFEFKNETMTIATGLFDRNGKAFDNMGGKEPMPGEHVPGEITLGLMRTHPVVRHLVASNDPNRIYYTLTFLAHELVRCQHRLAPYSPYTRWVMSDLMKKMRHAMTDLMLSQIDGEQKEAG